MWTQFLLVAVAVYAVNAHPVLPDIVQKTLVAPLTAKDIAGKIAHDLGNAAEIAVDAAEKARKTALNVAKDAKDGTVDLLKSALSARADVLDVLLSPISGVKDHAKEIIGDLPKINSEAKILIVPAQIDASKA